MIRRFVVTVLVLASMLGVAPVSSGHHTVAIQPGIEQPGVRIPMQGDPGEFSCTYNFIFRDQKRALYIGTAGHCVTGVGQVMRATDVGRIGTVAWKARLPKNRTCGEAVRPEGVRPCVDFALVRIDPGLFGNVRRSVRYWAGPTGFVPIEQIKAGMPIHIYGYGTGPHAHEVTRPRTGVVLGTLGCGYHAALPFSAGDSGAPHLAGDGRALGLHTLSDGGGVIGMTIDCVLAEAAKSGIRLKLETAPLAVPVQREKDRVAHLVGPNNTV